MNLVGIHGKGESVWLAFFLADILAAFRPLAEHRGDHAFAGRMAAAAAALSASIEEHAWDGEWYRRAWFDDGTPLGSQINPECQIDSLPQSWAVISGAGNPERARRGMTAIYHRLVDRDAGLIKLFDPPFDRSELDPGYIKGYVPGVRENGGQYTHAALWTVMAFAQLGDKARAWELMDLVNPIRHGRDAASIAVYQVEPYVVAADVYAVEPHAGRGGWTWYTGSAGWMYRLIVESLMGLRLAGTRLSFAPCVPDAWQSFKLHYRYRDTFYHIEMVRGSEASVTLDGVVQSDGGVALVDDRAEHQVVVQHR